MPPAHARAKGPPAPPSLPSTPYQFLSHGERIDRRVREINDKWSLGIKIRGFNYSPTKFSPNDIANKVYGHIQHLTYKDESALDHTIDEFNNRAWGKQPQERLSLLYELLSNAAKKCVTPSKVRTQNIGQSRSLVSSSCERIGELRTESGKTSQTETTSMSQTLSPLRTDRRQERESWESRESYVTAIDPGSPTDEDTDNETNLEFEARSPSPSPFLRPTHASPQASKSVSLQMTRKRPLDCDHSETSSKLTKTLRGKQTVTPLSVRQTRFKKPTREMAPSFQTSRDSSANTSFNNSTFSSQETANTATTSFASYNSDTNIHGQSISYSKPNNRTSSTTAYSSDDDALLQAEMQCGILPQDHGIREQDIQEDLNKIFSQESSVQSRSTFGSVDEDELVNVSFEVEKTAELLEPNDRVEFEKTQYYGIRTIPDQHLFVEILPEELEFVPFFVLFISCGIALESSISLRDTVGAIAKPETFLNPDAFWGTMNKHLQRLRKPAVKSRYSSHLWQAEKQQFDGYTFKANITLNSKQTGPPLYLNSLTVQRDKSCRLQRMFGSDRFLYVRSPNFASSKCRRFVQEQKKQIQKQWEKWLHKEHTFLGRKWRVFHVENLKKVNKDAEHDMRIVLFATEGADIDQPYTIGQMLNKFLPMRLNHKQLLCKVFARIDLGLSRTIPTLCFENGQMDHEPDMMSTKDAEDTQFNDFKLDWPPLPDKVVMNDGCCTMSVGAAKEIWRLYKETTGVTGPLPSAFQGRIGGAKGLWVINTDSYTKDPRHLKPWIKINGSQKKFDLPHDKPPHHRTFEVSNYSSAPSPSELHVSFIPILIDRGVSREAISNLMSDCLENDRMKLLDVVGDLVKLHEWIYRNGAKAKPGEEVIWQAGLPVSLEERIQLLLESGFDPLKFAYLAQNLERFIQAKQILQEAKLRVPLPKSTFLYGVADPLGELEPGQIQVLFSTSFIDESSDERYLCLRDMEALVARQPACRRSDIQRVKTVVHPKLSHLVDVVVFSSKGPYPLAGKLQGGDYDGDIFWICWEPTLVQPFYNAPAPVQSPDPSQYGIETKTEKLDQVVDLENPENLDKFLKEAIEFRYKPSLLGAVTNLGESHSYSTNCIHSRIHEQLYDMHDLLVDASKQGYILTKENYKAFLDRLLGKRKPGTPAYKRAIEDCGKTKTKDVESVRRKPYRYKPNNILDYLYFDIVRAHNDETIKQVKEVLANADEPDEALLYPSQHLYDKQSDVLKKELFSLDQKLGNVRSAWNTTWHSPGIAENANAEVEKCYQKYLAIQPDDPDDPEIKPLLTPYLRPGSCLWDAIKASALYRKYHKPDKLSFVFKMAGAELCKIKANSIANTRSMVLPIRSNLKPKPVKAPVQGSGADGDEYDYDEGDEDEFFSVLEEPGFE
ncbi:hypothetical protein yc1106_07596 [Curvularia clavata]|uniref:RNA-dependent RNA polymerase n=1 Tax=Curvularia clavata TaxID=95742 RepID=A0A9Q8ZBW6_CURCL|nr:hypothetical protein yc1106_07596 [Curvularia clavata]